MNNEAATVLGKLKIEYKRIAELSSIKRGQAYFKGYVAALLFAIRIIQADEEEQI